MSDRQSLVIASMLAIPLALASTIDRVLEERGHRERAQADVFEALGFFDEDERSSPLRRFPPHEGPALVAVHVPRVRRAPNPPRRTPWHVLLRGFS